MRPSFWSGGTHLRLVAAHELGHALGLPHTRYQVILLPHAQSQSEVYLLPIKKHFSHKAYLSICMILIFHDLIHEGAMPMNLFIQDHWERT